MCVIMVHVCICVYLCMCVIDSCLLINGRCFDMKLWFIIADELFFPLYSLLLGEEV